MTSTLTKGLQEIAAESTDYSKKAFAESSAVVEKLIGAKSVETAIQIQTDFAKTAYEGFISQASKINQICVKVATEAFKPVENVFAMAQANKALRGESSDFTPPFGGATIEATIPGSACSPALFLVQGLLREANKLVILAQIASTSGASGRRRLD